MKEYKLPKQFSLITEDNPSGDIKTGISLEIALTQEGLVFDKVTGYFNGLWEKTFLVHTGKITLIEALGRAYGQESVLHVEGNCPTCSLGILVNLADNSWAIAKGFTSEGENFTLLPDESHLVFNF